MKTKFCILFILLSIGAFSQTENKMVPFVSYWSSGDSYNFKITKSKQQWKKEKLNSDKTNSYTAKFEVIDSTSTSYTIKWSVENDFENKYKIPNKFANQLGKYKFTNFEYKTSEVGEFIELLNWEEVRDNMNNMFDDMISLIKNNNANNLDKFKKAIIPLRDIYASKQGIEQLIMKEIQYFHFLMGYEYDASESIEYDDQVANLLGGKPLKAKTKIYFESVDDENEFCVVKQEMSIDPDDTKKMLQALLKRMKLKDKDFKKALKSAVFKIEDYNTFEYHYNPGIPHKIETIRTTTINIENTNAKTVETTTIELLYN